MMPASSEDLHRRQCGLFSSFLQVLSKADGTPSAPAAEAASSSLHALTMSSSVNLISDREVSDDSEKKFLTSGTDHSCLGWTNTELYCLLNSAAAKSGLGLGLPVLGSKNGPIFF